MMAIIATRIRMYRIMSCTEGEEDHCMYVSSRGPCLKPLGGDLTLQCSGTILSLTAEGIIYIMHLVKLTF